ncbi:MAG: phosphoribosylamine--glycine ligase [Bdellovibrionales bacterium]|nr:phosphoribosylamine--glycine ligase [Bdellovibrionales bacterium]
MKVLLIGGGAREHALCWKLASSPKVTTIYTSPGNPGTEAIKKNKNVNLATSPAILEFAQNQSIDLTVVGPEKPLCDGIVDLFKEKGLSIFGPSKQASQLEGSKLFAKQFMYQNDIPSATYEVFDDLPSLKRFLETAVYPCVLKADGLAAGKGVKLCFDKNEAIEFAIDCMEKRRFLHSGTVMLVEEFLEGFEISFLVLAAGKNYIPLELAQDHKKLLEGDKGPNTGGMGAYCPAPLLTKSQQEIIESTIIKKTLVALESQGNPFYGILYAGLMINSKGVKVLEYNVRFGDPEAQVILPRLKSDLAEIMLGVSQGQLPDKLEWDNRVALGITLATEGYPDHPNTGQIISGVLNIKDDHDVHIFHAGTTRKGSDLLTSGGRVLTVVGMGSTLNEARLKAYEAANAISYEGKNYRKDIGRGSH